MLFQVIEHWHLYPTAEITNGADSMEVDGVPPYESLAGREMISSFNNPSTGNESFAGRQMISSFNNPSTGNESFAGRQTINTLNNPSTGNPPLNVIPVCQSLTNPDPR